MVKCYVYTGTEPTVDGPIFRLYLQTNNINIATLNVHKKKNNDAKSQIVLNASGHP